MLLETRPKVGYAICSSWLRGGEWKVLAIFKKGQKKPYCCEERYRRSCLLIDTPMPPPLITFVRLPGAGKSEFATHLSTLFLHTALNE
jgi:hypothetical protein